MLLSRLLQYFGLVVLLCLGVILWNYWPEEHREAIPSPICASKSSVERVVELILELPENAPDLGEWLVAYNATPSASRAVELPVGIAVAQARAERLKQLIEVDPDAALGEMLSLAEYVRLPEALRPYVEKPVSGYGDIDLQWGTHVAHDDSLQCSHGHRLYLAGESYTLHGAGRRGVQKPALNLPVVAYVLGDLALMPESSVLALEGAELLAAQELFESVDQAGLDLLTKQPVDLEVGALIGGKVYLFASAAIRDQVALEIGQAELAASHSKRHSVELPYTWLAGDSGGAAQGIGASSFFADDDISILFIRCDFTDFVGEPVSKADLEADMLTVSGHLQAMSYGVASVTATVTTTLYRPDADGESYALAGDDDGLYAAVVAKYDAAPDALARSAYDVVAIYFPDLGNLANSNIEYGGLASVGGSQQWINGLNSSASRVSVITHELGHNYGLWHANYWDPDHAIGGSYIGAPDFFSLEYGDIFDRMGSGDLPDAHFNHYQKHSLGWLPNDKVVDVAANGTYRIYRFDEIGALDNSQHALRVPMQGDVCYWVGFRQLSFPGSNLGSAAYVVAEGLTVVGPNLIDMTPGSAVSAWADRQDAGLPVGSSFDDETAGVTITSLAVGTDGVGDEWIDVKVEFLGRFSIAPDTYEFDEASGVATVTVQRLFSDSGAASVDYATSDDSAIAGSDYYPASGTLTWADGDSSDREITIALKPDSIVEGIESFFVTLSNSVSGVIPVPASQSISILDPGERYASFAPDFFYYSVDAIAFQSDGLAILGGDISGGNGGFASVGHIARMDSFGNLDLTFNSGGSGFNGVVQQIIVEPSDSILVRGQFSEYNGTSVPPIVRLGPDGALDTDFISNIGSGPNGNAQIYAMALQDDGQIVLGGNFDTFNSATASAIVRLDTDGTFGDSLGIPFGLTLSAPTVRDLIIEPNGKIVIVGNFYFAANDSGFSSGIIRLNSNGSSDGSFDLGAGLHEDGAVNSLRTGARIIPLSDGDYIVSGNFTAYDEQAVDEIVQLNSDGTFSNTITPAFVDYRLTALSEPLGVGLFASSLYDVDLGVYDYEQRRIAANGATDAGFFNSGGATGPVRSMAYAPDGSLWLGGNFYEYNGSLSYPIVRLASGVSPYDFWAAEQFTSVEIAAGDAGWDQDSDGDGIVNLGEMALGTDPTVADATSIFGSGNLSGLSLVDVSGSQYLEMTLDKSALSGGVWYCVQLSSDLESWYPNPAVPGDETAFEILEDSASRLVVRDKTPVSAGTPRFARIQLKAPE